MGYIYRHVRHDTNEVFYIGLSFKDDNNYRRAYSKLERNFYWNNVVKNTTYSVHIMMEGLSFEETKEKEIEFIALYGRRDLGKGTLVNFTDGGGGTVGLIVSDEKRQQHSIAMKGKKHTQETKDKMSFAQVGEKNHMFGKTASDETKEKLRAASTGRKHTQKTKDKLSCERMGENNPNFGKPSPRRRKMIDTNTGIIYTHAAEAITFLGLDVRATHLRDMLRGDHKNWTSLKFIE